MRSLFVLFSLVFWNAGVSAFAQSSNKIHWITFEEAVQKQKVEPRKVFIDVYTEWCGWCKVMDKKTFVQPEVVAYLNKYYYCVKFDAEQKEPITYNGVTFEYVPSGRRGYHELAASLLGGKMTYPTAVFLDEEMRMLSPVPGYQEVPMFYTIIYYFGSNTYLTQDWEVFKDSYTPPVK